MRKDFFLTETEKETRRQRMESRRVIPQNPSPAEQPVPDPEPVLSAVAEIDRVSDANRIIFTVFVFSS